MGITLDERWKMDNHRITQLQSSIREGEMRLALPRQTGKSSIRKSIENAKIKIFRLQAGLPKGEMKWNGECWEYEFCQMKGTQ